MTPIPQLLLKQPDVLAFNELPDAETIDAIVKLSIEKNLPIFVRAPGKHTLDALLRLLVIEAKRRTTCRAVGCGGFDAFDSQTL